MPFLLEPRFNPWSGKLGSWPRPCSMARKKKSNIGQGKRDSQSRSKWRNGKAGKATGPQGAHTCQGESTGSVRPKNDPPGLMLPSASLEDQGDPHHGALSRSLRKRECGRNEPKIQSSLRGICQVLHCGVQGRRPRNEATQLLNGKQKSLI